MQKNEVGPFPYTIYKNSKQIKDLNVRAKTTKLLEINIGRKLHDIGFGNDFLCITPKVQPTKEKTELYPNLKLCFEGHNQQNEKAIQEVGVNICKSYLIRS